MNAPITVAALFVGLQVPMASAGVQRGAVVKAALDYLKAVTAGQDASSFISNWPKPIPHAERDAVIAALPAGEAVTPGPEQRVKVAALQSVLALFGRQETVIVKIVPLPWAAVALHARSVLIIARSALDILTIRQLQAIAAHELAHEYLWDEYYAARNRAEREHLQRIELICDGIAIAAIARLNLPAVVLTSGIRKIDAYNERIGAPRNRREYPTWKQRKAMHLSVAAMLAVGPVN
jgi:hypothetical protein